MCLTNAMTRLRLLLLLLPVILVQTGCAGSTDAAANAQTLDSSGQPVSSRPWNTPESWETQGQLGALSR